MGEAGMASALIDILGIYFFDKFTISSVYNLLVERTIVFVLELIIHRKLQVGLIKWSIKFGQFILKVDPRNTRENIANH